MSQQIKWRLEDPRVGQKVAVCDRISGAPYAIARIAHITKGKRVRTDESLTAGNLYESPYGYSVGYSHRIITNDPKAIAIVCEKKKAKTEAEAKAKAEQEAREADPRWPVARLLGFFQTEDESFKRLAVLTPDELQQLKTLLEKVYE